MEEYRRKSSILDIAAPVIAILIIGAVLYPIFLPKRCVNPARPNSCQNNLKEISIALQLYWNDYDGTLPSSALVNQSKKWNASDFNTFAAQQGQSPLPDEKSPRTWTEALYDHMKNKDIFWCPSDSKSEDPNAKVSYWYKLAIDKAWYGEGCTQPCTNEKDFAYKADQIVFYEHQGWHMGGTGGLKNGVQINAVYLDSHVKMVNLQSATSGDPINCAANSNGSPMYFNFDNNKPKNDTDNPNPTAPAKYIDPTRYSDSL